MTTSLPRPPALLKRACMLRHAGERPFPAVCVCEFTCVFLSVRLCLLTARPCSPTPAHSWFSGSPCASVSTDTRTCHPCTSAFCQQVSHAPQLCRKQEAPSVRGQPSDSSADDHPAVRPHPLVGSLSRAASPPPPPSLAGLLERAGLDFALSPLEAAWPDSVGAKLLFILPGFFWGGEAKECGVL